MGDLAVPTTIPKKRSSEEAAIGGTEKQEIKKLKVAPATAKVAKPGIDVNQGVKLGLQDEDAEKVVPIEKKDVQVEKMHQILNKVEEQVQNSRISKEKKTSGAISLAPLIKQYLKSRDEAMLGSCLASVEKRVVVQSVKDLSGQEAFQWFKECDRLIFREPTKTTLLTTWIHSILTLHVSYLLSHASLKQTLQPFYQNLQDRLASHDSLLRLQGKLDLLITTSSDRITSQSESTKVLQEAVQSYKEGVNLIPGVEVEENNLKEDGTDAGSESEFDADELEALMDDENFNPDDFL